MNDFFNTAMMKFLKGALIEWIPSEIPARILYRLQSFFASNLVTCKDNNFNLQKCYRI